MIKLETTPVDSPLYGQSKWWGEPDLPEELEWPEITVTDEDGETYNDPLTFVCQIRCEDIAELDSQGLLPHKGMLYFFAALDYFLGDFDTPAYPGMGQWQPDYFRVLYSPVCEQLHTHRVRTDIVRIVFVVPDLPDGHAGLTGRVAVGDVESGDFWR